MMMVVVVMMMMVMMMKTLILSIITISTIVIIMSITIVPGDPCRIRPGPFTEALGEEATPKGSELGNSADFGLDFV